MNKKMLIFHPSLAPYRVDFFNALHKAFVANFYFTLKNVSDQKFDQSALRTACDFESNYLENGFEFGSRSVRTGVFSVIRKARPDIILCSEYGPVTVLVFMYLKFFRRKTKLYILSDDSLTNSIARSGIRAFLRNTISKHIDGVIFTSDEVCEWYKKNISEKTKTLVLPIIHNDEDFRERCFNSIPLANSNIKKYGLEATKVVLFVGRLVEVKNLHFLLRSFSMIPDDDTRLILVGDGPLRNDLEILAKKLKIQDRVIFTGRLEGKSLYSWYALAQIFVFPSTFERYGAVINEALLGGCYVLCSETAGAAALVNHINGSLFSPINDDDFAKKLQASIQAAAPLKTEIKDLRTNKMPFNFDKKISELIAQL
jgi:glycosyltransferase involved in cell wall biosynthesis